MKCSIGEEVKMIEAMYLKMIKMLRTDAASDAELAERFRSWADNYEVSSKMKLQVASTFEREARERGVLQGPSQQ